MNKFDILASDETGGSINTGWLWLRSTKANADIFKEILARDMVALSRDQANFNMVRSFTGPRAGYSLTCIIDCRLGRENAAWKRWRLAL